jgi:methionyl-tRNA formyltransferase
VRIVFAGTPAVAVPSLQALLDSRHEVVGVVTRPDAVAGRGRRESVSEVKQVALEHDLEVLQPRKPSEPEFLDRLRELEPDCCPVVAYGALLPPAALAVPKHGWVNLHFSLLPAWRGAAPVQHAIIAGDEVTGATTFRIDEGMDTGPYFGTLTETIRPRDTAGDLLGRLAEAGAGLLVATLDGIEEGALEARPQPADGVSMAPKISVGDAEIDWKAPALAVDRRIRGCTPAPGAWTTWRGERVKLGPLADTSPDMNDDTLQPGQLRAERGRVLVGTGSRPVELGTVQPAGKRPMPAADWARGVRPGAGEGFAREGAGA